MLLCSASSPFLFSVLIHSLDNPVRWCSFAFICIRKTPKSSSQPKLIPEHRTDYRTSDQLAGCLISISDSISQNLAPGLPPPRGRPPCSLCTCLGGFSILPVVWARSLGAALSCSQALPPVCQRVRSAVLGKHPNLVCGGRQLGSSSNVITPVFPCLPY